MGGIAVYSTFVAIVYIPEYSSDEGTVVVIVESSKGCYCIKIFQPHSEADLHLESYKLRQGVLQKRSDYVVLPQS